MVNEGSRRERIHLIFDFMHMYYKYKFMRESGRLRHLTCQGANGQTLDITNVYYPMKDIEKWRKDVLARYNNQVDACISVCFDAPPTERKELAGEGIEYKGKRHNSLTEYDLWAIETIKRTLAFVGYNVFTRKGLEADDLVASLVYGHGVQFVDNYIFTNDSDLAYNVQEDVYVMRSKAKQGYVQIGLENYADVLGEEFKCSMPYNSIMLFKATVGDKSDNIPGVKGFGPKAFDDMIGAFEIGPQLRNPEVCEAIIRAYFNGERMEQALLSLSLVVPIIVQLALGPGISTPESRQAGYVDTFQMKSLL